MSWQVGLYVAAVLIPWAAFTIELIGIRLLGRLNAYLATGAIGLSFVLSAIGFFEYFFVEAHGVLDGHHSHASAPAEAGGGHQEGAGAGEAATHAKRPLVWKAGFDWVVVGGEAIGRENLRAG